MAWVSPTIVDLSYSAVLRRGTRTAAAVLVGAVALTGLATNRIWVASHTRSCIVHPALGSRPP